MSLSGISLAALLAAALVLIVFWYQDLRAEPIETPTVNQLRL